jgi:hypothetical protein
MTCCLLLAPRLAVSSSRSWLSLFHPFLDCLQGKMIKVAKMANIFWWQHNWPSWAKLGKGIKMIKVINVFCIEETLIRLISWPVRNLSGRGNDCP